MVKRYENGVVVGEEDPPIDFQNWLRSEIDQAEKLDKKIDERIMNFSTPQPKLSQVAAAHARLRALREVRWAYARSQESHE